jgi:hypothetical protein
MADQVPSVGRVVHYKSYGTPGGEFEPACRAAIVTEVPDRVPDGYDSTNANDGTVVSLCVLNPSGMFFDQYLSYDEAGTSGGTWHWPERTGPTTVLLGSTSEDLA